MEYLISLLLVLTLVSPLYFIYRRKKAGKQVRGVLISCGGYRDAGPHRVHHRRR